MSRKHSADIVIVAAAFVILVVLVTLRASMSERQRSVPSTYDTGLHGYAALYALLSREGVSVDRFGAPVSQLFDRNGVFVVAGDDGLVRVAAARSQSRAIDAWVRRGGTLAVFGSVPSWLRAPFGLPDTTGLHDAFASGGCGLHLRTVTVAGAFTQGTGAGCTRDRVTLLRAGNRAVALAYRRGNGFVIFAATPTLLDNEHLAQRVNAQFAYAIFSRGGPVAFEERMYGHETGRTFWQVLPLPMRVAIVIACVAVVLAIAGANLPFAPPQAARGADERDSSEYIASLARMLQRGGAQREIVQRLCAHVQQVLGPRALSDEQARVLLEESRSLQSLSGPGTEDVISAGRLFARVQKDYE